MKPVSFVSAIVRKLAVLPQTMDEVARALGEGGVREADAPRRFYREWLNDTLILDGANGCRNAVRDPDGAFLTWVGGRIADPYRVSVRAHDAARADYGEEVALLFAEVRWRQEVAWAQRMRGGDNDRIAVLAEMWLTAARRDQPKLFRGLVELYQEGLSEPAYANSPRHMLGEEEILEGRGDEAHWRPLWLRFAEREFGRQLNNLGRGQMTALATRCRDGEWRDRTARRRMRQAGFVRQRRPSLMVAVLSVALDRGLSSDDLVAAEADFVHQVEQGGIDLADRPRDSAWRVLLERLDGWAGRVDPPDNNERGRRLAMVEGLSPSWTNTLPQSFLDIGGADQRTLVAWHDEIARPGGRPAPLDAAVDYGMWLVDALAHPAR